MDSELILDVGKGKKRKSIVKLQLKVFRDKDNGQMGKARKEKEVGWSGKVFIFILKRREGSVEKSRVERE